MKKVFLFLAVLQLSVIMLSCSNEKPTNPTMSTEKLLIGKWVSDYEENDWDERIELQFNDNGTGTFRELWYDDSEETSVTFGMEWEYMEVNGDRDDILMLYLEDGIEDWEMECNIKKLSETNMTLSYYGDDGLSTLYFKKSRH